jgi:hypothetical protein
MLVKYPGTNLTSLSYLRQGIASARQTTWRPAAWKPTLLLRKKKDGQILFTQDTGFDTTLYELIREIDHDHCDICWLTFSPGEGHLHQGYFNGESWICETCHRLFIATGDPEAELKKLPDNP